MQTHVNLVDSEKFATKWVQVFTICLQTIGFDTTENRAPEVWISYSLTPNSHPGRANFQKDAINPGAPAASGAGEGAGTTGEGARAAGPAADFAAGPPTTRGRDRCAALPVETKAFLGLRSEDFCAGLAVFTIQISAGIYR